MAPTHHPASLHCFRAPTNPPPPAPDTNLDEISCPEPLVSMQASAPVPSRCSPSHLSPCSLATWPPLHQGGRVPYLAISALHITNQSTANTWLTVLTTSSTCPGSHRFLVFLTNLLKPSAVPYSCGSKSPAGLSSCWCWHNAQGWEQKSHQAAKTTQVGSRLHQL